jgi:hypothetical protein
MPNANPTPTPVSPAATAPATPAKPVDPKSQPAGTAPVSTPQTEETWDVQENGKIVKKTRKEIVDAYQLRQLSDKKRSEAEKLTSEFKKLQELGAKDPIKLMKAMGYDFDNIATQYLAKKAEDAMKDPATLEAEKTKEELAQYKKYVEEQKAAKEQEARATEVANIKNSLHAEIIQAVEEAKDLGLPVDEELIIAIAQQMMVQQKGQKPLNAKEALPATYAKTQKWLQGLAAKMEGEALVKWLGEDTAKKIRKYDLTQLKAKRSAVNPTGQSMIKPKSDSKEPVKKPYTTWSEFKKNNLDTIK